MAKKGQASEDRAGLDNADTGRESVVDGSELETGDDDIGAMVAAELGVPASGGSKRKAAPMDTADDVAEDDAEAADDADGDEEDADAAEAAEDGADPAEAGDEESSESDEEDAAESRGGLPKWVSERLARQERKHREELERVQREMTERVRSLESKLAADGGDGKGADKAGDRSGKEAGSGDVVAQAKTYEDLKAVKSRYEELADWALENLDGVEDFEYTDPKSGEVTKRDFSAAEVRRILTDANRKLRSIPERAAELQREAQLAAEAAKHIETAKERYPEVFEQGSEAQKIVMRELGPKVIEALKGNPRGALILGEFLDGYRRANGDKKAAGARSGAVDREAEDALDGVMQKSIGAKGAGSGGAPRTGGGVAAGVGNPGARRASREALRAQDGSEDAIAAAILSGL